MSKDPIDLHIGSRLRRLRDEKGMTLQEAGEAVDLTYQQIRKYELGENRLSASTLFRLSEFFGVEPAFFFQGLARRTKTVEESEEALDVEAKDVLNRIEDAEVRHHLASLIRVLEARKKA